MTNCHFRFSASQVNAFIECPSAWVLRYHFGYRSKNNDKMNYGVAFEDRVNCILTSTAALEDITFGLSARDLEAAQKVADIIRVIFHDDFELQVKLENDHAVGYLDYANKWHIVDLKTTSKTPKAPPPHNIRQVAFYQSFYDHYDADEVIPAVTLFYAVILKKEVRLIIFTTCPYLYKKLCDAEDLYNVELIQHEHLAVAKQQNDNALRCLNLIMQNPSYVNAIPVNPNHYLMTGFEDGVVDKYLNGCLAPKER